MGDMSALLRLRLQGVTWLSSSPSFLMVFLPAIVTEAPVSHMPVHTNSLVCLEVVLMLRERAEVLSNSILRLEYGFSFGSLLTQPDSLS